jgi:hypothetical protein
MAELEISLVHDAYAAGGECPLCFLADRADGVYVGSFRGNRVMEPSVRTRTNATGFCPTHARRLYAGEGKLGLALVMHTHLQEILPGVSADLRAIQQSAEDGKKDAARIDEAVERLAGLRDSCYICGLLESDLDRYASTILYLWQKDPGFPAVLRASRGFCLPHFLRMLGEARRTLHRDELGRWLAEVVPLMTSSLAGLEGDLLAFTQLHQGTSTDLGTQEVRSALGRTLQKLTGGMVSPSPR